MPVYAYKTITPSGKMNSGKMEADSQAQVRLSLKKSGGQVVQIKELQASSQPIRGKANGGKKVPVDEVASTIRQLSILVRAGVPLVEALQGLAEQTRSESLAECVREIGMHVSQGTALSVALSRYPSVFPALAVEMAKVAEAGGNLAEAMAKLADYMENGAEIVRRIKSALAYPTVIMVISIITIIVMSTFILPRFVTLFKQMGADLPWTTKMLMGLSHAMTTQWYLFIAGGGVLFYLLRRFVNTPAGRYHIDKALITMPLLGDIVKKIVLGRVISSMSTLLSSGVTMIQTLEISAAAANNEIVKNALLQARRDVAEGNAVSQSLKVSGIFPPLVLQMVSSGEKTGELPAMLNHVSAMYERETDAKIRSLTSIIEPIMIVVLGTIVGFIAISVIVPIYSLVGGVK